MEGAMTVSPKTEAISPRLHRIAELAREDRSRSLLSLAHHIDLPLLREAYRRTRKDGAVGVDEQTAEAYAEDLESNLESLLDRFKSGLYRAPPVRRVEVPKGDSRQRRPIGIPTFEDKVLQRAVLLVLEAIYEQDFLPCSYGGRPGRSAHQALDSLWQGLMAMGGGWVAESRDARRVEAVLPKRLSRYGLRLHPDKTRLVDFRGPRRRGGGKPGTFQMLGFTHYWGQSRRGKPVVKRRTAAKRISRTLRRINQMCRRFRHEPLAWQQEQLSAQLRGHYSYFGITPNYRALVEVYLQVLRLWRKWLNRRSQRPSMPGWMFDLLLSRYPLPRPRVVHSAVRA